MCDTCMKCKFTGFMPRIGNVYKYNMQKCHLEIIKSDGMI